MRILYVCLLLIFAGTEVILAQTEKGTQYLGLESAASAKTTKSTDAPNMTRRELYYSITPAYSYFFADQWELKGGLGLAVSSDRTNRAGNISKTSTYALVPSIALRRHLMLSTKLGIAGGPYAFYAFNKTNYPSEENMEYKQYDIGADLHIEYFLMQRFGISARLFGLSYSKVNLDQKDYPEFKSSSFSAGLSNQLSLRFFYVFGKGFGK